MSTLTKRDAIDAALSVADDVAHGRIDPTALQQQAVSECRELFGTVFGEGDALWTLHADVARQAVGLGALSPDELREWAAVLDRRTGAAVEPPAPHNDLPPVESAASVDESQPEPTDDGDDGAQGDLSTALALLTSRSIEQRAKEDTDPAPQRRADDGGYDPIRGFDPGATRRR
ncbi:flagellar hook-length control protein [Mycobacterium colombiense]